MCSTTRRSWRPISNERDSDPGDYPNDDRSNDHGGSEHHCRAELERQREARANRPRVNRGGAPRRQLGVAR